MLKKLQATLKNQKANLKNQKGFTLIELIVVIAILGVLAMLIMPSIMSFTNNADEAVAKQQFKVMDQAYLAKKALGYYDQDPGKTAKSGLDKLDNSAGAKTADVITAFGDSCKGINMSEVIIKPDTTDRSLGLSKANITIKGIKYLCESKDDGTVVATKVVAK